MKYKQFAKNWFEIWWEILLFFEDIASKAFVLTVLMTIYSIPIVVATALSGIEVYDHIVVVFLVEFVWVVIVSTALMAWDETVNPPNGGKNDA